MLDRRGGIAIATALVVRARTGGLRSPAVVDLDPVPDLRVRGYAVDVEISAIQHASNRCPA
jgi:hypothetical protein